MSHSTHSRFSDLKRKRRKERNGKVLRPTPHRPQGKMQGLKNKSQLPRKRDESQNQ